MTLETFLAAKGNRSKGTAENYRGSISRALSLLGKNEEQVLTDARSDPYGWFNQLIAKIQEPHTDGSQLASKTVNNIIYAFKSWLEYEDVDLSRFKRKVTMPTAYVQSQDSIPTDPEMYSILTNTNLRTRTLTLIAATSGARADEVANIKIGDIEFGDGHKPTSIHIRRGKGGKPRITFCSDEATQALRDFLGPRVDRRVEYIFHNGNPLNPTNSDVLTQRFIRGLKKTGLRDRITEDSRLHRLHLHSLRKWFTTRMKSAGAPEAIVKTLTGHSQGVEDAYNRFSLEDMMKAYTETMQYVTLGSRITNGSTKSKVEEQAHEIEQLRSELTQLQEDQRLLDIMLKATTGYGVIKGIDTKTGKASGVGIYLADRKKLEELTKAQKHTRKPSKGTPGSPSHRRIVRR
jgi:integrase